MKESLFDQRDYKDYIRAYCDSKARGVRKSLAKVAQCQTAYVSHVLNGEAHFSLEQAEAISRWIGHSATETEYFLNLVSYTRAGTVQLRAFLERKLTEARKRNLSIKERIPIRQSLTVADQARYYSAWYFAAIHVLLTLPEMRRPETLARRLQLSKATVSEALLFLCSVGLAVEERGVFLPGKVSLHLDAESPLISKHHGNWRLQAMKALEIPGVEDLHYSSVFTLSKEDAVKIKAALVEGIERAVRTIQASAEKTACAMVIDFWEL